MSVMSIGMADGLCLVVLEKPAKTKLSSKHWGKNTWENQNNTFTISRQMEEEFLSFLSPEAFQSTCGVSEDMLDELFSRYCGPMTPIKHRLTHV
jgi:hypothetical protein